MDPLDQPTTTAGRDHFATCVIVGLAEWIIDDNCLV